MLLNEWYKSLGVQIEKCDLTGNNQIFEWQEAARTGVNLGVNTSKELSIQVNRLLLIWPATVKEFMNIVRFAHPPAESHGTMECRRSAFGGMEYWDHSCFIWLKKLRFMG
jgi:hypothetical protein